MTCMPTHVGFPRICHEFLKSNRLNPSLDYCRRMREQGYALAADELDAMGRGPQLGSPQSDLSSALEEGSSSSSLEPWSEESSQSGPDSEENLLNEPAPARDSLPTAASGARGMPGSPTFGGMRTGPTTVAGGLATGGISNSFPGGLGESSGSSRAPAASPGLSAAAAPAQTAVVPSTAAPEALPEGRNLPHLRVRSDRPGPLREPSGISAERRRSPAGEGSAARPAGVRRVGRGGPAPMPARGPAERPAYPVAPCQPLKLADSEWAALWAMRCQQVCFLTWFCGLGGVSGFAGDLANLG